MFEQWKQSYRISAIYRRTAKERKKLEKRKADSYEFQALDAEEWESIQDVEKYFDLRENGRLVREAGAFDIELPPLSDATMWYDNCETSRIWLTSKGRSHVRKLADAEKARRFEVKTLWVTKLILPLLVALIGILGAITGLIAVSRRKVVDQPERKPPTFERLWTSKNLRQNFVSLPGKQRVEAKSVKKVNPG